MAIRPILIYGDPRLQSLCTEVTDFGAELTELIVDLRESCRQAHGVGLAAPQIGVLQRVALVDISAGEDPDAEVLLINPEVLERSGTQRGEEGCLSFPGLFTTITRPDATRIRSWKPDGSGSFEVHGEGLLARALLHEIDHLDGVLITDHLRGVKRSLFMRRIARMRKSGAWE